MTHSVPVEERVLRLASRTPHEPEENVVVTIEHRNGL
jgi:hypothetical protein